MTAAALTTSLAGRSAVVVGGSGAIGSAVARAFVAAGACVTLVARDLSRLQGLVDELGEPERTLAVSADVTDQRQLADARDQALRRFGRVDLVVVSSGILLGAPFEEAVPGEWVQMIDLNLHGLLFTAQTFADDLLAAASDGRPSDLVFIGALAGRTAIANFSVYSAVSAAIAQLSRTLRSEYAGRGLRVRNIEPGYMTGGFDRFIDSREALESLSTLRDRIDAPLEPEVLAALIALSAALPAAVNVAEMTVVPTQQG